MKYKLLGRSGLKVSEICLGTMGFGKEWGWGADKEKSREVFEAYVELGGNFIDTANFYTNGTSESYIGEFMAKRREDFVIATKYGLFENRVDVNASGNNRKSMMLAVESSLRRLKTDYIDLYYLHIWDNLTPVDEVLRAMDDLIRQGKILYTAISDTPAWVVAKSNTLAELMGWSQFIGLQIEYSLLQRTVERELIPMAQHYNMTVLPWSPLAGGALTGKYLKGQKGRIKENSIRLNEKNTAIVKKVVEISQDLGVEAAHVALKWTMQKPFSCIPIVGATQAAQLKQNFACLNLHLEADQIEKLNQLSTIEPGFPGSFFLEEGVKENLFGGFHSKIEHRRFL